MLTFSAGASTDPQGGPLTCAWSFGDGGSASGTTVSHAYMRAGSYMATLTVTDPAGLTGTDSAMVSVANRPPVAAAGPDQSGVVGSPLAFAGAGSSDPDGTIAGFAWSFGDGTTATGTAASHAYAQPGTYTVTLTVTDNAGATGTDTAVATITSPSTTGGLPVWAKRIGAGGYDEAMALATDASGNVLVTGTAVGPVDLGNGIMCSYSVFIAKYSPDGVPLWARCAGGGGGGSGQAIAVDHDGNVAVTGNFRGIVDFGNGPLSSGGGYDIFLAKYSATGAPLWSQRFGAPIIGAIVTDTGNGIAIDRSNDILVTGAFEGTADFGGGPLTSAGQTDVFVAKYTPAGVHLWSRASGGAYSDAGSGIAVDGNDDVVVTGTFFDVADFGGGPLASVGADVFVAKYSASGTHRWSKRFGGVLGDEGHAVAVDAAGNVAVTGIFQTTIDFGGGPLTSVGGNDIFLARFSPTGAYQWARRFGSTSQFDSGVALAVDAPGNIVLGGFFGRSVDFGSGVVTSAGSIDAFVAKYSPAGTALWAHPFGGANIDGSNAVAVDAAGNVYAAGKFFGTVDFGTGPLTSADTDMFLLRLQP